MNKILMRLLIIAVVVALGLPALVAPTHAQDDTEALRERALAAYDSYTTATDYVYFFEETSDNDFSISISLDGESFESNTLESVLVEGEHTVVFVDGEPNVSSLVGITRSTEDTTNGQTTSSSDTTEAELRLVDGVLFANAILIEGDSANAALPDGWVIVASDLDAIEDLSDLGDVFTDSPLSEIGFSFFEFNPEGENTVRNRRFIETSPSITSEFLESDNGEMVELLTIAIDLAVFIEEVSAAETDPATLALVAPLYENATVELYIVLDADGNLFGGGTYAVASLDTTDLTLFGVPPGTEGNVILNFSVSEIFSLEPISADYMPAEAPADAVPLQ